MPLFESPDLDKLISFLAKTAGDPRLLFEKVGTFLRQEWKKNFEIGGNPPWVPLRPSTIASKDFHGFPANPLIASGGLRDSVIDENHPAHIHRVSKDKLEEGTGYTSRDGAPIAVYQQEGTSGPYRIPKNSSSKKKLRFIAPSGEFVYARSVMHPGLPARPFITLSDEATDALAGELVDYILKEGEGN